MIQEWNEYIQVGITSWGFGCGDNNFPGVYSRVENQYQWIKKNVCDLSVNPPADFECDAPTLPPAQDVQVTIALTFDDFPDEISMMVIDDTEYGATLVSFPSETFATSDPQSTFYHTVTMKERSTYTFIINDVGGDGLCCYEEGSYLVYIGTESEQGEILLSGGGNFGAEKVHQFTVSAPGSENETNSVTSPVAPSSSATVAPTAQQLTTLAPTKAPIVKATAPPTVKLTELPSVTPSSSPTATPSPTSSPTNAPTKSPTATPTVSFAPSQFPTSVPQPRDKAQVTSIVMGVIVVITVAGVFLALSWYADRHTRLHKVQADIPLVKSDDEEFGEDASRKT